MGGQEAHRRLSINRCEALQASFLSLGRVCNPRLCDGRSAPLVTAESYGWHALGHHCADELSISTMRHTGGYTEYKGDGLLIYQVHNETTWATRQDGVDQSRNRPLGVAPQFHATHPNQGTRVCPSCYSSIPTYEYRTAGAHISTAVAYLVDM